ncbi:MAG: type II toxin-antitoxin system PemK/MazF family toxin [Thermomicrobiales bacterium]
MNRDRIPATGDVWLSRLDPIGGFEQAGTRPVLVVSGDRYNALQRELRIILPMTTRDRGLPFHIRVDPPDGGLRLTSFVICEQPRTIATSRLLEYWGTVPGAVLEDACGWVEDFLND